jgi:hypothetical protein
MPATRRTGTEPATSIDPVASLAIRRGDRKQCRAVGIAALGEIDQHFIRIPGRGDQDRTTADDEPTNDARQTSLEIAGTEVVRVEGDRFTIDLIGRL